MKKITLIAALLGTAYFGQAQVGINTDAPKTSAYLDVEATDKGILIPRVALTSTAVFAPITGDQEQSLLVFNTATAGTGATAVKPGFYYWRVPATGSPFWERVASGTDLNDLINDVNKDLEKVVDLLKEAFPSNNLNDPITDGPTHGGGMVYEPGNGTTPATISYVYYDSTTNTYVKQDITDDIKDLITLTESKTLLVKNAKYQYYVSEAYLAANNNTAPTQTDIDTWTNTTFPTGVYYIEVLESVVNNFNEFVTNNPVTVGGDTYNSIKQYIENISQNATQDGVTKIVIDPTTGNATFQTWNDTTNTWTTVNNSVFEKIVTDNETETTLTKNNGTGAVGSEIIYTYENEKGVKRDITITADVINTIINNNTVREEITEIINAGGNVYFGDHDGDANTPDTFYTIDASGNKTAIDISSTVVNAITNATTNQINEIKNELGDVINNNSNTSVFTGDTYVENGVTYYIYKGSFETTITGNTARTTGVTLDKDAQKIISINLNYGVGMTASVTDIAVSNTALTMKTGVGKMYSVISTTDLDATAIIEFASPVKPAGL
jgi:hypothetical protein